MPVVEKKALSWGWIEGASLSGNVMKATREGRTFVDKAKPFCIEKRAVWEAYKRVKANRGGAGVDRESVAVFEQGVSNNLYGIWNRMSSGTYFPSAVRRVDIPKGDGKTRPLGIPTIADRIAQTVVQRYLEPLLEPVFHEDSYGYRPGRSAQDALAMARQRCWRQDWVIDLDIKSFFEEIRLGTSDAGCTPPYGLRLGLVVHREMVAIACV